MPRGPGKKENYNFDYARFGEVGKADVDNGAAKEVEEVMQQMPGDLREAFRLMQISRITGDNKAAEHANALAIQAVQRGGPDVRERFLENLSVRNPEFAGHMSKVLMSPNADGMSPDDILEKSCDTALDKLETLKAQMTSGIKSAEKEMEAMQAQHDRLMSIRTGEDFFKQMKENGLTNEDLQRIFTGDTEHMENKVHEMIDKAIVKKDDPMIAAEKAVETVEKVQQALKSDVQTPESCSHEETSESSKVIPVEFDCRRKKLSEPEVKVPMYRLQYKKDVHGCYESIELRCNLPGVAKLSDITLDVSERNIRLATHPSGPKYAVNSGPFPVLIDPNNATAKYSRKREELFVAVGAKTTG